MTLGWVVTRKNREGASVPEAWRRYANGLDPSKVARHFQERGILIADDNGISRAEQVIGTIGRFYVLSRVVLTSLTP